MTKLKAMRQQKGIQQAQLADAARISRPFLYDLECGQRNAKQETWERIAAVLGCDVSEIYQDRKEYQMREATHRYYCPARPPMPGSVPRGVIRIEYSEDGYMVDVNGHSVKAWGFVEYDRELTQKEIDDYELVPGVSNESPA